MWPDDARSMMNDPDVNEEEIKRDREAREAVKASRSENKHIPWIENAPGDIWHSMGPGGHIATFVFPEDGERAVKEHNVFPLIEPAIIDCIHFAEEMKAEFAEGWTRENQMHLDKLENILRKIRGR